MEITITKIEVIENKKIVHFKSNLGDGFGEWKSQSEPQVLGSYFIEFNIEDELVWLENINLSDNKEMLIQYANDDALILQGFIESLEDNGERCFMRLDIDLLVFSCFSMPNDLRDYVKITARKVGIYDINL